ASPRNPHQKRKDREPDDGAHAGERGFEWKSIRPQVAGAQDETEQETSHPAEVEVQANFRFVVRGLQSVPFRYGPRRTDYGPGLPEEEDERNQKGQQSKDAAACPSLEREVVGIFHL